jgi:hypothetical protein
MLGEVYKQVGMKKLIPFSTSLKDYPMSNEKKKEKKKTILESKLLH